MYCQGRQDCPEQQVYNSDSAEKLCHHTGKVSRAICTDQGGGSRYGITGVSCLQMSIVKIKVAVQQMSHHADPAKLRSHTGKIPHAVCISQGDGNRTSRFGVSCLGLSIVKISVTVQYCMSYSRHIMQALQNSVVTQVRFGMLFVLVR